jgi:hypothetical protein
MEEFVPTRVFWIAQFGVMSKAIKIYDITSSTSQSKEIYREPKEASKLVKDQAATYSFKKRGWRKPYDMYHGDWTTSDTTEPAPIIASWKGNRQMRSSHYSFPESSPHSSHDITMKRMTVWKRTETFIVDSVQYSWKFNNGYTRSKLTLTRTLGGRETVVAHFNGLFPHIYQAGVLSIQDDLEDGGKDAYNLIVLAIMTCCTMLRKDRQRR